MHRHYSSYNVQECEVQLVSALTSGSAVLQGYKLDLFTITLTGGSKIDTSR